MFNSQHYIIVRKTTPQFLSFSYSQKKKRDVKRKVYSLVPNCKTSSSFKIFMSQHLKYKNKTTMDYCSQNFVITLNVVGNGNVKSPKS